MKSGPFKPGQTVYLTKYPNERYYAKSGDDIDFPIGTKLTVLSEEYDEHLSSRAYRNCWMYEAETAHGKRGWFTDLDIDVTHPGKPSHIIDFEELRRLNGVT